MPLGVPKAGTRSIIGRRYKPRCPAAQLSRVFPGVGVERVRAVLGYAAFDILDADDLPPFYEDSEPYRNAMFQPDQDDAAIIACAQRYGLRGWAAPTIIDPGGEEWDWEFDEEWGRERNARMTAQLNQTAGDRSSMHARANLETLVPVGYRDEPPPDWDFRIPESRLKPSEAVEPEPEKPRQWTKARRDAARAMMAAEREVVRSASEPARREDTHITEVLSVLKDLESKRDAIDKAIAALKAARAAGVL